jgi:hypothetical protein
MEALTSVHALSHKAVQTCGEVSNHGKDHHIAASVGAHYTHWSEKFRSAARPTRDIWSPMQLLRFLHMLPETVKSLVWVIAYGCKHKCGRHCGTHGPCYRIPVCLTY